MRSAKDEFCTPDVTRHIIIGEEEAKRLILSYRDRDRRGQYSVRVNEQWRLCFEWPDGAAGPSNVELVESQ